MLVFLLTFKSEELEETRSGGSQNPAAERKVQGNYYCFYLFICLEMLPKMSHDMAGCRISAENSSASIKDQQKPHWLLTLCQQPLSDVINPAATARQGTLIFSFSLCLCTHQRLEGKSGWDAWKQAQSRGTPWAFPHLQDYPGSSSLSALPRSWRILPSQGYVEPVLAIEQRNEKVQFPFKIGYATFSAQK